MTLFERTAVRHVYAGLVAVSGGADFLIEGCHFLHGGNNTPGDGHAGVNSPILSVAASSGFVVRDNLWQIGLSGWHIDRSWAVVLESNVFTGYIGNDPSRPVAASRCSYPIRKDG